MINEEYPDYAKQITSIMYNNKHNVSPTVDRQMADKCCDILEFVDMQSELLNKVWGNNWGNLVLEHTTQKPPSITSLPIITFDVMRRIPSKAPSRNIKPLIYMIDYDENDHNYMIIQHTLWQECLIKYKIHHTTMRDAYALTNKFEEFNIMYTGYYKQNGITEFVFDKEIQTPISSEISSIMPSRCILYKMVIQNIFTERVKVTEEIINTVYIDNPISAIDTEVNNCLDRIYEEAKNYGNK